MPASEIIEERQETSKIYKIDDVTRKHYIYSSPIHYKKFNENSWYNINIQLKTMTDETKIFDSDIVIDNKFSIGFRNDGKVEKYLGIRRSYDNQLEFTPKYIEMNGSNLLLPDYFNNVESSGSSKIHLFDNGEIFTNITSIHTQSGIKYYKPLNNFFIQEYINLTGFTILNKLGDNSEYIPTSDNFFIFESTDGEQLYIPAPSMWNNTSKSFGITHRLYNNGENYIYEKYPDEEGKDWLSTNENPIWVDADTYYGGTQDGYVWNENVDDWDTCRNATSGTDTNNSNTNGYIATATTDSKDDYYIQRGFFTFQTNSLETGSTIEECLLKIHGYDVETSDTPIVASVQKSSWESPLTLGDFDNFSGSYYDTVSWSDNSVNTFDFNSTGISDLNRSGYTSVCVREYNHDYVDTVVPDGHDYICGGYWANDSSYKPYLTITEIKMKTLGITPNIFLGVDFTEYSTVLGVTV